jgi:hypothetical protein
VSVRLEIQFTPGEGAVLRMLGLVERRGFRVRGIAMIEAANRGSPPSTSSRSTPGATSTSSRASWDGSSTSSPLPSRH